MDRLASLGLVIAAVMVTATPRSAVACNETQQTIELVAATADGTFVAVEDLSSGTFYQRVTAVTGDGATLARCVSEEGEAWRCTGDARLRARGDEPASRVAARWSAWLGAAPATLRPIAAPAGVVAVFCARFSFYMSHEEYGCGVDDTEILGLPGSRLFFARTRLGPASDCGAQSYYDGTRWMTREALRARLEHRARVFDRRATGAAVARRARETVRAEAARAALTWLDQRPAP